MVKSLWGQALNALLPHSALRAVVTVAEEREVVLEPGANSWRAVVKGLVHDVKSVLLLRSAR